jgi:run domain Beclin-1 interacting cysteine-rich containing protein
LLLFLGFIFDYSLYEEVQRFPSYYTADVDLYSLDDLIQLRFGSGLPYKVKDIVIKGIHHILNCELCKQLGFHCEMCTRSDIIFPFQINRVSRCQKCSACFHLRCFNARSNGCPKCQRLIIRRNSSAVDLRNELPV